MTQDFSAPSAPVPGSETSDQSTQPELEKNGIGLASLLIAIAGSILVWVPETFILAAYMLGASLIFAIVGLTSRGAKKGTSIAAVTITAVGVIIGAVRLWLGIISGVNDMVEDVREIFNLSIDGDPVSGYENTIEGELAVSRGNPLAISEAAANDYWNVTLG